MTDYPLIHILFWIAMICSPHGTSQITITDPDKNNWTWTKQESGWIHSVDQSVWSIKGNTVARRSDETVDKRDVTEFVNGIKEQEWDKSPSLN